MTDFEFYSLIIRIIGILIVGSSLFLAAIQVRSLSRNHKDNHEWSRRIETQKAFDEIRNMDLQKLNESFGFKYRREPIPLLEVKSTFEKDWHLEKQCIRLLNAYEGLAAGVKLGIYDEDVIVMN